MELTGEFIGIPYDFRVPTWKRIRERMWNPEDGRIIVPRVFGAGWTINLAALKERSTIGFVAVLLLYALWAVGLIIRLMKTLKGKR